jgi:hypothetical protein
MGLDIHMIAGSRACSTSTRPTNPTITKKISPHYDDALAGRAGLPSLRAKQHAPKARPHHHRQSPGPAALEAGQRQCRSVTTGAAKECRLSGA